ncbi:MAG TPA: ABC transporter permease [Candidatus Acidoferrales bacterium]|nr:ABC transporter permease [Candidatus Acidoferrales bacterium]
MSATPNATRAMPGAGAMPGPANAKLRGASSMVKVVAVNTFREAVRDRVLYNLVFFGLLMIAGAILAGDISIGIHRLVIINLGLTAISIIGLVMSIFIGVGLVYKEIEKRTLYTLLARPVKRWQFLVGKFGGLLLTLLVNTSLMTVGLFIALFYSERAFIRADLTILVAVYFILLELALVTALALFFSCFSSPMLSTLFTLAIYITGVFAADIRDFGQITKSPLIEGFTRVLYYLVPNFHNFNAIEAASHNQHIAFSLIWQNTLYTILYAAVVLIASSAIFSRRNLK